MAPDGNVHLVSRVRDPLAIGSKALEDLVAGLVPHERARVLLPARDPGADRGDQLPGRAVSAAPQPPLRELGEPALDEAQPGAVGRREVEGEARMAQEPAVDGGVLVGGCLLY